MTTHPGANLVQRLWTSAILNGLLAVILGVVILLWPGPSILVAAVVFGVYLLVSGIAQVVSAFSLPASAGGRILLFISGAASVILAVLAFRHFGEGYAILLLAIWIAVGFIFRGVAATATAISDPAFPGRVPSLNKAPPQAKTSMTSQAASTDRRRRYRNEDNDVS